MTTDSLRLLQLEDDPVDAELGARVLRRAGLRFELRRVAQRDAFLAALDSFQPDAILADFKLPQFNGLEALNLVRARDPDLPFIFVTGTLGEEGAVELLRSGASDYILKDRLMRLPDALTRALETARQRLALREAQQALRTSEARFRALVETTPDMLWEIDEQGRYTYVSPAAFGLLGYRPDELLGRYPFDLMPPTEAQRLGALFAKILEARRPFTLLENTCLHRDGHSVVLETSGTPILSANGRFMGYRGIDRDISERKHNDTLLLLQARRAAALLELPRAANHLDEADFMKFGQELAEELTESRIAFIHFVNEDQETIELITWSQRTLATYCRAVYDRHYPISQAGIWADALRRRAPVVFNDYASAPEKRGLPEGHAPLKRLISLPVLEGDQVRMMAGVGNKETPYTELDVETVQLIANEIWRIVRQRRADQALRQSEAHLRTLVDTIPDLVWLKDPEGVYLACNPMFERFFGAPEEQVRGKTDYDFVAPDLADFFRAHDRIAMDARRPMVNEEWITFADDGHRALLETIKTPMHDPAGHLIGVLGIARDITTIRQAQDALRDSEARFRALFENMQSGVCIYEAVEDGRDFVFRDLNQSVERIEGVKACDLLGRRVTDAFPGVATCGLLAVFERVWRTGLPESVPPILYSDGRIVGWRENSVYRLPQGELVVVYDDVTTRKTLELALEESRERLELALEGSGMGLWDWQVQTGKTRFNERWAEIVGYRLDELQPVSIQTWLDLCHPDDLEQAKTRLERHFRRETPYYEVETRLRHKDGHWVWILDRGKVVEWDADGTPIRMAGTHLDITARKQTEESLRQLSLAVEQSPASIVITDLEGRIDYVNPAFTRASGYPPDEVLGQNPRILQSGRTPRAVHEELWATLGRGEVWRGEFHNRRKDGMEYIELAVIAPVHQPDGRVTHYLAVKEDITEQKRVEEELEHYRLHLEELVETRTTELRLAEEQSRLILESSADGLYGVDTEGRATFINPAACALLGYSPEQVIGRNTHALIHHSYPDGTPYPAEECPVHCTLDAGMVVRQDEEVFWHADGHPFPVIYSSHPIQRNGAIVGAVVSFVDISAQKQAEAVREAARTEAERLARLKSEFLANMSHEIRTPLNAVLGFAQIGVRESDGRKAQGFFRRILDSGQILLGIVNDILDFSKIEAGKLHLEDGLIDLPTLVERTVDQLRSYAQDKGLEFDYALSGDCPAQCRGDPLRLAQILGNLLSNAIKFTEQGRVLLTVARESGRLSFTVVDTGIGMTEAQLAGLFQPFAQADGSITRRFGGTGLGLAITKRLVDMMGGEIRTWSRHGEGSRFEVRIPLVDPSGSFTNRIQLPEEACLTVQSQRLRGLRLLVAEDNATNRLVLEELLREEGCELVQVENGLDAVERVRQEGATFHLVLMDIQMPVMDGFEATRHIRALTPGLPVVGLTAHAMQTERNQCLSAGMVDHLAKPVNLEALVKKILEQVPNPPARFDATTVPVSQSDGALAGTEVESRLGMAPPTRTSPDDQIDWSALDLRYRRHPEFVPKLLASALDVNASAPAELRHSVSQGDLPGLAFLAHRLKGTAGNLFADRFRTLAATTEASARAERPETIALALELAEALESLLVEITAHLNGPLPEAVVGGPATSPGDDPSLVGVIDRLESLLATDDAAANTTFEICQEQLRSAFGEQADLLGKQIERFDYAAALATLRAARAQQPSDPDSAI